MIYILTNNLDTSSTDVIAWLNFWQHKVERVNIENYQTNFNFSIKLFGKIKQNDKVWIRKITSYISSTHTKNKDIYAYVRSEFYKGFVSNIGAVSGTTLGSLEETGLGYSKFNILSKANKRGLKVPNSLITNNKKELVGFINQQPNGVVNKSCGDIKPIYQRKFVYKQFTCLITNKILSRIPPIFNFSLFQQNIPKLCDIKVFFLENKFYSQAIFSQKHDKTTIDFRNTSGGNYNRVTPFKLPLDVEQCLRVLMSDLNLNIATIDFVLDQNYSLYFLEVNPTGQFKEISLSCNYYLEKKIASFLSR